MTIAQIQGRDHISPLLGTEVAVSGVVTATRGNGFYLQDPIGDGDDATSEGIFVFTRTAPTVAIGDGVAVGGTVDEFIPGGPETGNLSTTQISASSVLVISSDNPLPDPVILGENGRPVPNEVIDDDGLTSFDPDTDAIDYYESVEGMRVSVEDAVAVGGTSRFGEIPVVGDGGSESDNRTEAGGVFIEEDAFNPQRIHIDDAITDVPEVDVGDRFEAPVLGVMDYSFGNFKLLHTEPLPSVTPSGNAPEVSSLVAGDDQLTIATYNVLNLDPSDAEPAGGDTQMSRLAAQIVENLNAPDIVALQEIQDNTGTTDDGVVAADETFAALIAAIEAAGGPTYAFTQIDPLDNQDGGAPGSNIRVGYLYNPERVEFVERGMPDATTPVELTEDGFDPNPGRVDPNNPVFSAEGGEGTRKSLAAEFTFNGETVFVVNNHLKSKFGSPPLFGSEQPAIDNTAEQRDAQAEVIRDFAELLAENPAAKLVVLGDFNEFDFRATQNIIEEAGLTNLIDRVQQGDRYTFNFEGNSQVLDGLMVSPALANSAEVDIVHVNTDFSAGAVAASDHEPILARLDFGIDEIPVIGRYAAGGDEQLEAGAEITAHDPRTQRLFTTNGAEGTLDIVDISDPAIPTLVDQIDMAPYGAGLNSVAVKNGLVAVAVENADGNRPGSVVFFDADGNLVGGAEAGVLPDMVTFTPDGNYVLVANEGEPTDEGDPEGSVSVIDVSGEGFIKPSMLIDFTDFDGSEDALRDRGVRIFPDRTASQDLEPEYIAVSPDGSIAMVTLQENNAVAKIDLGTMRVTDVIGLGAKDHSQPGNGLDASDRDGGINITNWPVFGLFMPDAIGSFEVDGETYFVTANEGDARDEDARVKDLTLDPDAFPDAEELQEDENLGRLEVSTIDGDTDGDGDFDQLFSYGGRSFTILDANGSQVYDSGDLLEQIVASHLPVFHNANDENDSFDSRSDAKGGEPEGLVTFTRDGAPYVAVGLERAGGFALFDLSDPTAPAFEGYVNSRNPEGADGTLEAGDISPEGLIHIDAMNSPTGAPLLAVSHEISGTTALYQLDEPGEPYTLQILAASDLEGGVAAIENAPLFARLVEYFQESTGLPTLTISAGDNVIPGPFFNAATDSTLDGVLTEVYAQLLDDPSLEVESDKGRVDMTIMNALGFDASATGNHEFDAGDGGFEGYVRPDEGGYPGPQFSYLSANLEWQDSIIGDLFTEEVLSTKAFTIEAEGEPLRIANAAIAEKDGEKIGIVGATTQILESITSPGSVAVTEPAGVNDMPALAEILQPVIDDVIAQGVNKVVLATHLQQLSLEQELIGLLSGVDIVMAGGSDVLFADETDVLRPEDPAPEQSFPLVTENADGDPALIIGARGEYQYLARLVVEFDAAGRVIPESVDPEVSGAFASLPEVVDAVDGGVPGDRAELVASLTDAIQGVVIASDSNVFGETAVFLEGRREVVRTEETNLGNLTADANLAYAKSIDPEVQASLKNGGGIRAEIGTFASDGTPLPPAANPLSGKEEGEVSQLDIENSLRFNNSLSIVTLTREGLVEVVEHAVSASGDGATPGQFPQVGGLSFSYDTDLEPGSRVQSLALVDETGAVSDVLVANGELVGDPTATVKIVTLGFLAGGGDDYPYPDLALEIVDLDQPEDAPRTGVADFAADGTEQDALAELLAASFVDAPFDSPETAASEDRRIQNLDEVPEDTVLDGLQIGDLLDPGDIPLALLDGPAPDLGEGHSEPAETGMQQSAAGPDDSMPEGGASVPQVDELLTPDTMA
jgi:predicted extracellular nuclease/2',3'-cyclic-nucleotide 2'-phosphodiesterase (5'-nucleotidase family)/DNA-binding beta-propeller fold protein YncE